MSRVGTALAMGAREMLRTPVLVALLVFLPAYMVGVIAQVAPEGRVALEVAGGETVRTTLDVVMPVFTTPMVAALVTGIAGLFMMQSSAAADGRLVLAGYRSREVVAARVGLLVAVAGLATVASVELLGLVVFTPAHLAWFYAGVFLAALVYGAVGVLAGVLLDRLPGVYLVLFGSVVDLFLFQNPLATDRPAAARFTPGHYPLALANDAAFGAAVNAELLAGALAALAVVSALATLAFYRETRG